MHRNNHPLRSSLYLAVISGAASIAMAVWGLSILGGH